MILIYLGLDHGLLKYTAEYVTFEGQNYKASVSKELDKVRTEICIVLVGFVYSAIFLPKRQNQITFRTMLKKFKYEKY